MKILKEINSNRLSYFMELIESLDFVKAMDDEKIFHFVSHLDEAL